MNVFEFTTLVIGVMFFLGFLQAAVAFIQSLMEYDFEEFDKGEYDDDK